MSEISRTSIVRGPAVVTYDGVAIHTKEDVEATPDIKRFDVETSRSGKVDERLDDILYRVRLTPVGEWNASLLAKLHPYQNPVIGSEIFGGTDRPLVVSGVNQTTGNKLTFRAAAVMNPPDIILSATKTLFGSLELTALSQDASPWSTDGSRVALADETVSSGDVDRDNIPTQPYDAAWGEVWDEIETESGWTISTSVRTQPVTTDRQATCGHTLEGVDVMAKFTPVNITLAQALAALPLQGAGVARGASLANRGNDLTITGTGVEVTVHGATLVQGPFRWGKTALRTGEFAFVASRSFSAGAYGNLLTLGTGA